MLNVQTTKASTALSSLAAGNTSLLRVPLADFGDGASTAPPSRYRPLPAETGGTFHNRFVGAFLLYGSGSGWGRPVADGSILYVVRWSGGAVTRLALPHGADRIEPMGSDAVVVGADERDLHFTGIRLDGTPQAARRYTLSHASQGELRSHGFFYRPDAAHSGVLGLPVRGPGRPGYEQLMTQDFEYVLIVEADDIEALKRYLHAPPHEALGRLFYNATSAALAYDYSFE